VDDPALGIVAESEFSDCFRQQSPEAQPLKGTSSLGREQESGALPDDLLCVLRELLSLRRKLCFSLGVLPVLRYRRLGWDNPVQTPALQILQRFLESHVVALFDEINGIAVSQAAMAVPCPAVRENRETGCSVVVIREGAVPKRLATPSRGFTNLTFDDVPQRNVQIKHQKLPQCTVCLLINPTPYILA
jgi:hypothetical protein